MGALNIFFAWAGMWGIFSRVLVLYAIKNARFILILISRALQLKKILVASKNIPPHTLLSVFFFFKFNHRF